MKKTLTQILSQIPENSFTYTFTAPDGSALSSEEAEKLAAATEIEHLEFDSRHVSDGTLFFALPGTHTTGNRFISQAISNGATCIVYEGELSSSDKEDISAALKNSSHASEGTPGTGCTFIHVESSRFAMSPISASFYDNPSEHLVVYGVTGTEGKSSTVSFIWQLLRLSGIKAGFISTVQYSLGGEAIANPEHQTTPEAPIVQRELYEMILGTEA